MDNRRIRHGIAHSCPCLQGSNEELKADNAQLVQAYEDSQERHKQDMAAHQARNVHIAQVPPHVRQLRNRCNSLSPLCCAGPQRV